MKKLTKQDFQEIALWMHRNARPLEMALWQCRFENGSADAVLRELSFYQNSDGGFGNALEPDCWNPELSPYATGQAIGLLESAGFRDVRHPLMKGIFRFLESTEHCSDDGWYFSIASNNDWPHAPWWTYSPESNKLEGIGLTAVLCAFILTNMAESQGLYKRALGYCELLMERLGGEHFGDMGIGGYCKLLESLKTTGLSQRFDAASIEKRLKRLVYDSIERDTSKWVFYGVRPSNYILSPDSIYYDDNRGIVETELDYLIDTRPRGGVWPITWSWFDLNEKYPKEFAISENWWRAVKAIEKLSFLRNFSRLD